MPPSPTTSPGSARRRIFLGDIHGCREELERLLERLGFDPAADRLLPVGDLVNRGPDSLGVLRLLRDLGAETVLGNHDLHFLRRAAGVGRDKPLDTLGELLAAEDRGELVAWLAAQPFLRDHGDVFQVHAGLSPLWKDPAGQLAGLVPERRSPDQAFAVSVRYCTPLGRPVREAGDPEALPWDRLYDPTSHGGRRVVFGHWAERGFVHDPRVTGLDTGCVWGGSLTAWLPEEQRFVSVPARRSYGPLPT